jgi:hypothetical protein
MFFGRIFGLHSFANLPNSGLDSTRIIYMFFGGKKQSVWGRFHKDNIPIAQIYPTCLVR